MSRAAASLCPDVPWEWTALAACQYTDPEIFFAEGEGAAAAADSARRVCMGCPVRTECARHALRAPELHGTWGGLSEAELREERDCFPARPVAEVLAAADERYFQRMDRRAERYDRQLADQRERKREKAAALLGLVA